jgi:isoleucyl-tRNA synthetase
MQLDAIARLMAPILAFTAEEIWNFMPIRKGKKASIHLASLPKVNSAWKDEKLGKKWNRLLELRGEVTKALEEARVKKLIGHSLDAAVHIHTTDNLWDELYPYEDDLETIFIVSKASMKKGEKPAGAFESNVIDGLSILIEPATGEKCDRCWKHDTSVGTDTEHSAICSRCHDAIS